MDKRFVLRTLPIVLLSFTAQKLVAETSTASSATEPLESEQQPENAAESLPWVEKSHDFLSDWVQRVGFHVDGFLSRSADTSENESYVRLRAGYLFDSKTGRHFQPDIHAKLDLPGTKDRLKLVFDNEPDDFDSLYQQNQELRTTQDDTTRPIDKESSAALRWLLPIWEAWRPSMDVGVRAKIPLDPFVRFRIRKLYRLSEPWYFYMSHQLSYHHQRGVSEKSYFTVARPIGKQLLWLNTWQLQWQKQDRHLEYAYILSLNHYLTKKDTLTWRAAMFYQQQPIAHQQSYAVDLLYRRLLYSDWLFAELVPGVQWQREYNFSDQYSFTVRFEMLFKN